MRICPSCGEENSDRARFCQNCATPLTETEAGSDVRKVVTIVFADVTGSTALGERLDPETLRRVMGHYFDEMSAVIERHGGTVEKFIGDAVMAVFGVPRLHEDDALRAVRAADGMRRALNALNHDLERDHGVGLAARIGVNTGEIVAGDPTDGQRLVTGDAVNIAARLEQAAAPGEILLGEATYRLVRDAVEVGPVESLELKGKAEPVSAFRLTEVREDTAGHVRHLDSAMVGREKELEILERALDRVLTERSSHLFTLLGPAGVGKSRLVQEFIAGPATSARVLRGRCLSYGEGITYFPLVQVVQEAARVERADDLATALGKLATLAEGSEDRDRIVSLVAGLLSWSEPVAADEAYWGVRKLFEHLAGERPLVVVFDDIHWAEPAFLELVEHLADWTRDAPLLLLCVARPELLELRQDWAGGKLNATTILLEPLPSDEVSRLVDNLLGRADIPDAARTRILEAAEGNPLFVEEMLGMLIDDGLLRFEDGGWHAVEDLANITVPPTIQLLLAARLDRLDAEERAVIERGAIEGKVFHSGAVTTLAPEAMRPSVRPRLLALARKELIRPDRAEFVGEDAFRFRHLLIRDAAYQAMPKEQRADLHERFAAWLERAAGGRVAEYEEILAYHLEQAYRYRIELGPQDERTRSLARDAAVRLLSSAERADERGDFATARLLLGRCVEISEGGERSHALTTLAEVLAELNDFPGALDTAAMAVADAERAGDRPEALRAELVRIEARGHVDSTFTIGRSLNDAQSVLRQLEAIGDEEGIARALLAVAEIAFWQGRCAECREIAERLFEPARTMSYGNRQQVSANLMVYAYFGPGTVDEGFELMDRAAELLAGSLSGDAFLGTFRVGLLGMRGHAEEARAEAQRVLRVWEELGNPAARLTTSQVLAETEWLLGRLEEAERILRENIVFFDELGEKGYNSTISAELASVLCAQGRYDEAEEQTERSIQLSSDDDFATHVEWRSAKALVLSSRGDHAEALALLDEALTLLAPTDYVGTIARSYEVRGRVLAAAGRVEEARSSCELALAGFQRKGVVPAVERVRARIAELLGQ